MLPMHSFVQQQILLDYFHFCLYHHR